MVLCCLDGVLCVYQSKDSIICLRALRCMSWLLVRVVCSLAIDNYWVCEKLGLSFVLLAGNACHCMAPIAFSVTSSPTVYVEDLYSYCMVLVKRLGYQKGGILSVD